MALADGLGEGWPNADIGHFRFLNTSVWHGLLELPAVMHEPGHHLSSGSYQQSKNTKYCALDLYKQSDTGVSEMDTVWCALNPAFQPHIFTGKNTKMDMNLR